jgi:hypothetical protein
MHFCRYAKKVSIVIRGESLKYTLSEYLVDWINATPNIEVPGTYRGHKLARKRCAGGDNDPQSGDR